MKKTLLTGLATLLLTPTLAAAQVESSEPLIFDALPDIPSFIESGESVEIQYTVKNTLTEQSLPIYPVILNADDEPDDSIIERVIDGDDDCGPSGSHLAPQASCNLNYIINSPEEVKEQFMQTLWVEYDSRAGYALSSEISFTNEAYKAYVANLWDTNAPQVNVCDISTTGGTLTCADSGASQISGATKVAFAHMGDTEYAYIANHFVSGYTLCVVDDDGTFSDCTFFSPELEAACFSDSTTIFKADNGEHYAYIASASEDLIAKCSISKETGELVGCESALEYLSAPNSIAFKNVGANTYAYIAQTENYILQCDVDATGDLTNCVSLNEIEASTFEVHFPGAGLDGYAYVSANRYDRAGIFKCSINASNGHLDDCEVAASRRCNSIDCITSLDSVSQTSGHYLYATLTSDDIMGQCAIDPSNGDLDCSYIDPAGLNRPYGVTIR